ncbi:MAG: hypothetical protein RLZ81_1584, partial [Pseudomonadota bacterium]
SIISSFDAAYSAYNGFQGAMERYWTLKYLQQHGLDVINATLFKENLVRADDLPLVLGVLGAKDLPRGCRLRIKLGAIDFVSLDVTGTVLERLDAEASAADAATADEEEDDVAVGPIAIAVDLNEAEPGPGDNSQP